MASQALADAFESAKKEFLSQFPNGTPANFQEFTTINDVYKAAEEIQSAQAKTRTTRNLRKIQPFLECLRHYEEVIETFVTVKAEILALIWGPIKFLLLTSSTYIKSFDKLVDVMAQIGLSLPAFEKYTELFPGNQSIQQVLCLFYQDILDFYSTLLAFFKHKRWSVFFESLWPKSAGRIQVITENIKQHRILMDCSITLAHVVEAHAARQRSFEEFERQHEFQHRQDLESVKSSLSPVLYDRDLQRLKDRRLVRPGDWLSDQEEYIGWTDPSDKTSRLLWLQGIPGAGKTFLSSTIIEYIAGRGDSMVFAFLKYQSRESISTLQLLHSFIWQMALDNEQLQGALISAHKREYRRLSSDLDFVKEVFCHFLDSMPTVFIVIDGLDEIMQIERLQLLRTISEILQTKSNTKLLISSRPEDDISKMILKEAQPIRVHDCNKRDIQAYVNRRASSLVSNANFVEPDLAQQILDSMEPIAAKSEGMFLYARLVCDSIGMLGDIESIKDAVNDLPDGLNEAYDRILSKITEGLEVRQRDDARKILALVTCCVVPLSKNEIQLAVYTAHGRDPSKGCRGLFLNILDRCGPIIEEFDGHFRFIHFSAREYVLSAVRFGYLLSPQSKYYLTETEAHASVASICIKYLSSACFDQYIDDSIFRLHIRSGAFVLLAYVCNHWVHHIREAGKQAVQDLMKDIECLIHKRVNRGFMGNATIFEPQNAGHFRHLSSTEKTNRIIDSSGAFSKKRQRDLSFDDDDDWDAKDPLTFTNTEARFRLSLESMLCDTLKHRPDCICQELKSIYGSSIYKCGRPGCPSYRAGFDTKSMRDGHAQRHNRPFKCPHSECPFSTLGFAKETGLESHLVQVHDKFQHIESEVTPRQTNASSEEELEAILIDAVQENDLSTIRSETDAVRKFVLVLLLQAYEGRSSDSMIKHLLGEMTPNLFPWRGGSERDYGTYANILKASIKHGNYDVFQISPSVFKAWRTNYPGRDGWIRSTLTSIGNTRCADILEILASDLCSTENKTKRHQDHMQSLAAGIIPKKPDTAAEILALECLKRIKPHLWSTLNGFLLFKVAEGCCSIPIAKFLREGGASVDRSIKGSRPLLSAAKHTSPEAAEFMEFLVREGAITADSVVRFKGKALSELPGPRNIHNWIGITWEELVRQREREELVRQRERASVKAILNPKVNIGGID